MMLQWFKLHVEEIPENLRELAEEYREKMVESAAEQVDEYMEKYLEGEELTEEEIDYWT